VERPLRITIAVCYAAFGVHQLVYRDFVTRVIPKLPGWVPAQPVLAYLSGIALIAGAAGMLVGSRRAALITGWGCLASALLLHLPRALTAQQNLWTEFGKGMVLAGNAFIVAAALGSPAREWLVAYGKGALAGFMILCGVEHFMYEPFVASLIPPWIPWHVFWTYFAAVALIAGGLGMLLPQTTKLAALLSGLMILAWVPLVHIPLALRNLRDPGQSVPVFEALQFGCAAVLIARLLLSQSLASEPRQYSPLPDSRLAQGQAQLR
jgi:uncharacterized membrane protein